MSFELRSLRSHRRIWKVSHFSGRKKITKEEYAEKIEKKSGMTSLAQYKSEDVTHKDWVSEHEDWQEACKQGQGGPQDNYDETSAFEDWLDEWNEDSPWQQTNRDRFTTGQRRRLRGRER